MQNHSLARSFRTANRLNAANTEPQGVIAVEEAALPLDAILPRYGGDTRPLNPTNVANLAESISALGLLEPIVIDCCHRLIAGNHRKMAANILSVQGEARMAMWQEFVGTGSAKLSKRIIDLPHADQVVPVRILSFDAKERPDLALAAEIAENEKRRSYSSGEVIEVANRLRAIGFKDSVGRPQAGQAALVPCLTAIVQKSESTVRRMLSGASPSSLSQTTRASATPRAKLQRSLRAYLEADDPTRTPSLTSAVQAIIDQLNAPSDRLDIDPERLGLSSTVSF